MGHATLLADETDEFVEAPRDMLRAVVGEDARAGQGSFSLARSMANG